MMDGDLRSGAFRLFGVLYEGRMGAALGPSSARPAVAVRRLVIISLTNQGKQDKIDASPERMSTTKDGNGGEGRDNQSLEKD